MNNLLYYKDILKKFALEYQEGKDEESFIKSITDIFLLHDLYS